MMPRTKPSAGGSLLAYASKEADDEEAPASGEDVGKSAAAAAVFDALKSGDRSAFGSALHSYVMQCMPSESDDQTEEY